jgi:hypothetical protein
MFPVSNLCQSPQNGAPGMSSDNIGLIGLCKKKTFLSPRLFSVTAVLFISKLHLQALMSVVQRTVNCIGARPT